MRGRISTVRSAGSSGQPMASMAAGVSLPGYDAAAADPHRELAETSETSPLTFYLYLAFILVEFLNLGVRYSIIGVLRPTVLLVGLLTVLLLAQGVFQKRKDSSASTRLMLVLIAYIVLTLPFVEWPGSVLRVNFADFIKVAIFFLFTIQIVDTLPRLKTFLLVVIGAQVIRVLEPLYLHLTTGYWGSAAYGSGGFLNRLSGAPSDVINPNGLGFVIITALPFLHYLLLGSANRLHKTVYFLLLGPLIYALMLTGSRSALVGLAVVLGMFFWKSKKRILYTVAVVIGLMIAIPNLSDDQADRFRSLISDDSTHVTTREGRLDSISEEFQIGMNRPLFGHGLGTGREAKYNVASGTNVPHNLYAEAFIELGVFGLALFVGLIVSFVLNSIHARRAVAKLSRSSPQADTGFLIRLSDAIEVWVVMCVVFSMAQYGVSEFHWYLVGGISVVTLRLALRRIPSSVPSAVA